ncbi:MAG TPA: diadenylate cyclase CdaA [Candidatus Baltobacteraceae bacterium]|jgi:diadenylate cyclase|nr:diadenylate cyclase CdaA [Candidatus Baltobacteraceae bacterium]
MWNNMLQYIGPADIADILATSILIYYLLLMIRGTRAVQILTGVLVLVALLGIANLFHLLLLGTILQLIVVGAAVSLPIVFQPELRRALEQIGRGGFFHFGEGEERSNRTDEKVMATIAKAAFALSSNRYGALIVIEQQTGLKEFLESGTTLDAALSAELLLSVFVPRSPLHDGAVIVKDATILGAGCFLPLAEQSLAERRLGTRHRAALGLSEQTDAVVVVVSEESGAICVAREGKLSRAIEEESRLFRFLLASTRPPRDRRTIPEDLITQLRTRLTPPQRSRSGRKHANVEHS